MTSSSQLKLREPHSSVFRVLAYALTLILAPLNCLVLFWFKEPSKGPKELIPIFAPLLWLFVPTVAPILCVDEFAKDCFLLSFMYANFYVSFVFCHQYGASTTT